MNEDIKKTEETASVEGAKKKRGRPSKAEIAAREAAAGTTASEEVEKKTPAKRSRKKKDAESVEVPETSENEKEVEVTETDTSFKTEEEILKDGANPDEIKAQNEAKFDPVTEILSKDRKKLLKQEMVKLAAHPVREEIQVLYKARVQTQHNRIATDNRVRSIEQGATTANTLHFLSEMDKEREKEINGLLAEYANASTIGQWLTSIIGVGAIYSAGLIANLQVMSEDQTFQSFVSYCGLNDNNVKWLGTAKAKEVVSNAKKQMSEIAEKDKTNCISLQDEKAMKLLAANHKELRAYFIDGADDDDLLNAVINEGVSSDTADQLLFDVHVIGKEAYYSDLIHLYCKGIACPAILKIISDDTKRTYRSVIKGGYDKDHEDYTFARLEHFLAMIPYNAEMKKTMFLIGTGIIKSDGISKKPSLYAKIFRQRKAYETMKNERGDYAEEAARQLREKNITDKDTRKCLEAGKLTPGHIYKRSLRWMEKIFLSHVFDAMYIDKYGKLPKIPQIFNPESQHLDYIQPEVPYENFWKFENTRMNLNACREYTPDSTHELHRSDRDTFNMGDLL